MDRGFKFWFTDVFWYHYKAHLFAVLAGILIIAAVVQSCVNRTEPDLMIVLVSGLPVTSVQSEKITSFMLERGVTAPCRAIYLGGGNPNAALEWQLLIAMLMDPQSSLFLIGESVMETFAGEPEAFLPAEEAGLEWAEHTWAAEISGAPLINELGLTGERFFGVIKRPAQSGDDRIKAEDASYFERAIVCLKHIMGITAG